MPSIVRRFTSGLGERFASTWVLLSDTTNFLSRTSVFEQYESELKDLRLKLSTSKENAEVVRAVRAQLVELRKALRLQGYDLTLGGLELSIKGFRSDASIAEGYRRMVLFIGKKELISISGEQNHRELHDYLEAETTRRRIHPILQKHYLWYRWNHGQLSISGADSEPAAEFEKLLAWAELPEHRLQLLGWMRRHG